MELNDETIIRRTTRIVQIITASLILGMVIFVVITVIVKVDNAGTHPMLTYLALGAFSMELVMAIVVPRVITRSNVQKIAEGKWQPPPNLQSYPQLSTDRGKLLFIFQTKHIITCALLEGAGFFGCIAYMVENDALALGVAVAVIVLMAAAFPTIGRVRNWLEVQERYMETRRQEASF